MKSTLKTCLFLSLLLFTSLMLFGSWFTPIAYANPSQEDFTKYTETDPNSHITVTNSSHINFTAYETEDAYVYKDYGTDHFCDDFSHEIDVVIDNREVGNDEMGVCWALTEDIEDRKWLEDNNKNFLSVTMNYTQSPNTYGITLEEGYSGTVTTDGNDTLAIDTWYYLLIERTGSTLNCSIYSTSALRDAGGTADIDTLTVTLTAVVEYRYSFACLTYNGLGNDWIKLAIMNLDFQNTYEYTFYGPYYEDDGTPTGVACDVTAYFTDGSTQNTFSVDSTDGYVWRHESMPQYFVFDLPTDREYWVGSTETSGSIYIFNSTSTLTTYTITFNDLAGILDDYSFVSARAYINATEYTMEKKYVDVDGVISFNLIQGHYYNIYVEDDITYDYGQVLFGTDTTRELTLSGLEFPVTIREGYRYVRVWAYRNYSSGTDCRVDYEDTQSLTTNVTIDYYYATNDSIAYQTYSTSDSFISHWSAADANTTYYVEVTIERTSGNMFYRQTLPRTFIHTNPWGISFLWPGAPFNTNILIPCFIILCVAGVFSSLNVPVGAFASVMTAILLAWWFGLSISEEALLLGLIIAVLLAMSYAKRKVFVP